MNEQQYPDGLYKKFSFNFELDLDTGNYFLYCPEWRCEISCGDKPQKTTIKLLEEIISHNAEELKG